MSVLQTILHFIILVVCFLTTTVIATKGAEPNEAQFRQARSLIDSVIAVRDELRSGICRIAITSKGAHEMSVYGKGVSIFYAFDIDDNNQRFDQVYLNSSISYVKSNKEVLVYTSMSRQLAKYPPNHQVDVPYTKPIDLRLVSLVTWANILMRTDPTELQRVKNNQKIVDARREESGLYYVALRSPMQTGYANEYYWIDDRTDPNCPRALKYLLTLSDKKIDSKEMKHGDAVTEWQKINGFWVPTSCVMNIFDSNYAVNMKFEWESVGAGVPDKLFTSAGMTLGPSTAIINKIIPGKSIIEEIYFPPNEEVSENKNYYRVPIAIGSTIVIVALVYVLWRRFKAH